MKIECIKAYSSRYDIHIRYFSLPWPSMRNLNNQCNLLDIIAYLSKIPWIFRRATAWNYLEIWLMNELFSWYSTGASFQIFYNIIYTNAGILLIGPLATNFSEILIEMYMFSFKKMHLKMSSGSWGPLCLGLNVLNEYNATPDIAIFCNIFETTSNRLMLFILNVRYNVIWE